MRPLSFNLRKTIKSKLRKEYLNCRTILKSTSNHLLRVLKSLCKSYSVFIKNRTQAVMCVINTLKYGSLKKVFYKNGWILFLCTLSLVGEFFSPMLKMSRPMSLSVSLSVYQSVSLSVYQSVSLSLSMSLSLPLSVSISGFTDKMSK